MSPFLRIRPLRVPVSWSNSWTDRHVLSQSERQKMYLSKLAGVRLVTCSHRSDEDVCSSWALSSLHLLQSNHD